MKAKRIHLALHVTFCTLALCARGISAQEIIPQQSDNVEAREANQHNDGETREQFSQFQETAVNEHEDIGSGESEPETETIRSTEYTPSEMEQSRYFEATEANEYDDRTLLDTFGQVAKDFLTKRVIPDTDAECKWEWRYVRCGKSSSAVSFQSPRIMVSSKRALLS